MFVFVLRNTFCWREWEIGYPTILMLLLWRD